MTINTTALLSESPETVPHLGEGIAAVGGGGGVEALRDGLATRQDVETTHHISVCESVSVSV